MGKTKYGLVLGSLAITIVLIGGGIWYDLSSEKQGEADSSVVKQEKAVPSLSPSPRSSAQIISPIDAQTLINNSQNDISLVVLDVRTVDEFSTGHLAGAQNIDFYASNFQAQLSALDRAKTYLVYCRTGSRSGQTIATLHSLGFDKLYDLKGGIQAWQVMSLPVE